MYGPLVRILHIIGLVGWPFKKSGCMASMSHVGTDEVSLLTSNLAFPIVMAAAVFGIKACFPTTIIQASINEMFDSSKSSDFIYPNTPIDLAFLPNCKAISVDKSMNQHLQTPLQDQPR